jgi:glutaredoxin
MRVILYSKPGCHLCEGLQEKLEQVQNIEFELQVRDITTDDEWLAAYQYEVPVLYFSNPKETEGDKEILQPIPRPSPRASVSQLEQLLQKYI